MRPAGPADDKTYEDDGDACPDTNADYFSVVRCHFTAVVVTVAPAAGVVTLTIEPVGAPVIVV
jgi:hypothetical protein